MPFLQALLVAIGRTKCAVVISWPVVQKKEDQVMNTDKKTTLQINTECNKVKILPILNLKGDDNLIQGQNFFHCCYSCTKL